MYESHVELVGIYKKLGELRSLREAFQRFHEYFPLTPALWLEWINVEKCLATTDKQKEFIIQLFDQAVEDYLCKWPLNGRCPRVFAKLAFLQPLNSGRNMPNMRLGQPISKTPD